MKTLNLLFVAICVNVAISGPLPKEYCVTRYLKHPAVIKFREYLRIDTSRKENLQLAVDFWKREASDLGLDFAEYRPAGLPICVLTLLGTDPSLPSIMLNSHMDVVGVEPDYWSYPPFEARVDENGDIYGRGTQDTKDVSIQYIEALRQIIMSNVTLPRTLHMTLMPDEETGGFCGMIPFLVSEEFTALNVGFALDEGLSSTDDTMFVTYQDKRPWQMNFTVYGTSTHGSLMPNDSAAEKLYNLIDAISAYKKTQKSIAEIENFRFDGTYNVLNINKINGGLATNIVPGKMSLVVDMRLSTNANTTEIDALVNSWLASSGEKTDLYFLRKIYESAASPVDDSNPYWVAMQQAATDMNIKLKPALCPATSDMIYLRSRGIPAFGFSPKTYTTSRVHGANEYQNVATFIKGIDVYVEIIKRLGSLSCEITNV